MGLDDLDLFLPWHRRGVALLVQLRACPCLGRIRHFTLKTGVRVLYYFSPRPSTSQPPGITLKYSRLGCGGSLPNNLLTCPLTRTCLQAPGSQATWPRTKCNRLQTMRGVGRVTDGEAQPIAGRGRVKQHSKHSRASQSQASGPGGLNGQVLLMEK